MERTDFLRVSLFGGFQLELHTAGQVRTATDQNSTSKKLWAFLQYLIVFRSRDIPQEEIIDMLWGDEDAGNAANALKTLLHRVRTALEELGYPNGKQVVLYHRGVYRWNSQLPIEVDAELFDQLCDSAQSCADPQEKLTTLLEALGLYTGAFLPKFSYDPWVISQRTYYQNRYLQACITAIKLLEQLGDYNRIIDLCRKSLVFAPYEEELHMYLMQALVSTGAQQQAMEHYTYATNLFMDALGVTPSQELTDLYRQLVKSTRSVELDLNVVRQTLGEDAPKPGPYHCEFAIFQDVYRLEARAAQRTGNVIQLAMLSILSNRGKQLSHRQLQSAMDRLLELIESTLRKEDAFTRFSASQYLLLLPCATREGGEAVLNRLISQFKRTYPKMPVLLQYSVLPLLPLMPEFQAANSPAAWSKKA